MLLSIPARLRTLLLRGILRPHLLDQPRSGTARVALLLLARPVFPRKLFAAPSAPSLGFALRDLFSRLDSATHLRDFFCSLYDIFCPPERCSNGAVKRWTAGMAPAGACKFDCAPGARR